MAKDEIIFIYGSDARSRTEARRHVSRMVRKRERETRAKHTFVEQSIGPRRPKSPEKPRTKSRQPDEGDTCADVDDTANAHLTTASKPGLDNDKNSQPSLAVHATPQSDKYLATRSHIDPFDTLSIPLSADAARCLKHYTKDMPWVEFQIPMDSPIVPRIRSALEVPMTLYAMVAQGAVHRAALLGGRENAVGEFHLGQATRLLRQSLPTLTSSNWQSFVQPMFELAFCEQGLGRPLNCRMHLNGLRQLLTSFGGLEGLHDLPNIQLLTCHMLHAAEQPYFPHIEASRRNFGRMIEHYETPDSGSLSSVEEVTAAALDDVQDHVADFCWILNELEAESADQSPLLILVHSYFRSDNRLSESLTSTADDQVTPNKFGPRILHRIAGLLILSHNILFYLRLGDRAALELYLERLHYLYHPNIKLLKLRAMQNGMQVRMENTRLNWEVARMMQVYKILDRSRQQRFERTLVEFLQGTSYAQPDNEFEQTVRCGWSVHELMPMALHNLIDVDDGLEDSAWTAD